MKNFYIYLSITFCLFICPATSFAQQVVVEGSVLSEHQQPVAGVSVYLLTAPGEAIIKTSVTDESGKYTFKSVPTGEFLIQASSVGFETVKTAPFSVKDTHISLA